MRDDSPIQEVQHDHSIMSFDTLNERASFIFGCLCGGSTASFQCVFRADEVAFFGLLLNDLFPGLNESSSRSLNMSESCIIPADKGTLPID